MPSQELPDALDAVLLILPLLALAGLCGWIWRQR